MIVEVVAWVWAAAAGASVALQVGGAIILNDTPAQRVLHSMYVTIGSTLVGAIWLSLLAVLRGGERPQRPTKNWSLLGGVIMAPTFVTTPAATLLGTQLVLMLLLLGMVGVALLFDAKAKRLHMTKSKSAGLSFFVVGVGLEVVDALPHVQGSVISIVGFSLATFGAGCLFGMQAKMNKRLARDLGSTARSAAFSIFSTLAWGAPTWLVLAMFVKVPFYPDVKQWWIWALCGLQSAFYTYSLAELPKMVSYSVVFILVLAGKLTMAAAADWQGFFSPAVSLSAWRCASLCAMMSGAILYSREPLQATRDTQACGSFVETISSLGEVIDDIPLSLGEDR